MFTVHHDNGDGTGTLAKQDGVKLLIVHLKLICVC
jgi:hypothetical protein